MGKRALFDKHVLSLAQSKTLVISRYVSVSYKLMSVVSCRHGSPDSLEKEVYYFLRLLWLTVCQCFFR